MSSSVYVAVAGPREARSASVILQEPAERFCPVIRRSVRKRAGWMVTTGLHAMAESMCPVQFFRPLFHWAGPLWNCCHEFSLADAENVRGNLSRLETTSVVNQRHSDPLTFFCFWKYRLSMFLVRGSLCVGSVRQLVECLVFVF